MQKEQDPVFASSYMVQVQVHIICFGTVYVPVARFMRKCCGYVLL